MTTIAELGIRVDSGDAVDAASDLDRLTEAGKRTEDSAEKAGRAWESALTDMRGDTRQIVQELQALNAKQSEMAQQLATVGRAATSTSTALNSATANMVAYRSGTEQASEAQATLTSASDAAAQAGRRGAETLGDYKAKADQARTALNGTGEALNKTGMSAKATAAALRGVPAQFTDIVVSLQGGQAPLTVLLQQGGQLKDMFGGIGPAARALGGYVLGLVNPFTILAATVAGVGVAYYKGSEEAEVFRKSLILTGNAAGTNAGALSDLSTQVSTTIGTTGAAAEMLAQLAGSGKIASGSFGTVATAALQMSDATGRSVQETVAEFVKIGKDPVVAARELNDQYNFLTASTYAQIVALKEQGDTVGAVKLLTDTYAETIDTRRKEIVENLGWIEKAWRGVWGAAKGAGNAAMSFGRTKGMAEQLAEAQADLAKLEKTTSGNSIVANSAEAKAERELLQSRIVALGDQLRTQQSIDKAQENYNRRQRESTLAQETLNSQLRSTSSNQEKLAARLKEINELAKNSAAGDGGRIYTEAELNQLRAAAREQFKDPAGPKAAVNLSSFNDQKNALTAILGEYKNKQKELDAAQKAGVVSQEAYTAQRAALLQQQKTDVTEAYQAEIRAIEEAKGRSSTTAQQRIQLDQKIADARAAMVKAQKDADSELAVLATNEQGRLAKQARAVQTYTDALDQQVRALQLQGQRAADGLGLGDRQRGLLDQQNGITDRTNQQRLDLANQYGDGSRGMSLDEYNQKLAALAKTEQDLQRTTVSNYDKMTTAQGDWRNGASSAFQNYLEQARDVAGQTRALFTSAFTSMEDAVVNFAMTGKLSFSDFTRSILADMARIATQRAASSLLSSFATSALGGWLGGAGAVTGATGAAGAAGGGGFDFGLGGASAGMTYRPGGYSSGGYTGDGGKYEPAGIVHGGEFVLRREVVGQPGMRDYLETLNTRGYADGGYVDSITTRPAPRQAAAGPAPVVIQQQISIDGGSGQVDASAGDMSAVTQAYMTAAKEGAQQEIAKQLKRGGMIWAAINRPIR